jgi:hypothetical protein
MPGLEDAGRMLEAAEQAAAAADFASADELLRGAARIQEAELGPLHPDLANTLNNLAIVAEKTGRLGDAETFYRRAVAIASASLPVDHPMIAASRENLEDFCRARGLPIDRPPLMTPAAQDATTAASDPYPHAPRRVSRALATAIGAVAVLLTVAFLVARPWSSRKTSPPAPTAQPTPPQAAGRALPTSAEPAKPAPIKEAPPLAVVPRRDDRGVPADRPPAPSRSSGAITLTTAQLCRTFSTSGSWRCDQVVDPVSPGAIVLYTRVRSPRNAFVVHRWYRGNTLRQSVKLTIEANATEGYRTYSRQTVDGGADWRVEVSSADGALLHQQRFVVR